MRHYKKLTAYAVAVVVLALVYYVLPVSQDVVLHELDAIAAFARGEAIGASAMFFLLSIVLSYLAFPAMPMLYIAAGYCVDVVAGGSAVVLGSAVGGLGAFLLFRDHIPHRHRLAPRDGSSWNVWITLLGLRLSPIVPAPLANVFAALAGVSPLQHLATTLVGSAPLILFYVEIGQQSFVTASGDMPHWWRFSGCLVILALSTLMTVLGPWRSVLASIRQLKDDIFAAMKDPASAKWAPPAPAGPTGN
jgi:uncharacterized membrane protein YdjX (TVP38/TMEM64 family)